MRGCMVLIGVFLAVFVLLPLYTMMSKSVENKVGDFVGLANYAEYFSTPALFFSAKTRTRSPDEINSRSVGHGGVTAPW